MKERLNIKLRFFLLNCFPIFQYCRYLNSKIPTCCCSIFQHNGFCDGEGFFGVRKALFRAEMLLDRRDSCFVLPSSIETFDQPKFLVIRRTKRKNLGNIKADVLQCAWVKSAKHIGHPDSKFTWKEDSKTNIKYWRLKKVERMMK